MTWKTVLWWLIELVSGIVKIAADTSRRARMGLASRELAASDFDINAVGAAVEGVYARLIG